MNTIVYLNGEFIDLDQAKVSVLDRGFLFGDGIYEVIPAYNYKLFRLPQHLTRLHKSLNAIGLPSPLSDAQWQQLFEDIIRQNKTLGPFQTIYLQVTRGAPPKRKHAFGDDTPPTIFAMTNKLEIHNKAELANGKSAITVPDTRWSNCHIKATSLLANVLMSKQAFDQDAAEAILIKDDYVLEGASSNVFIIKNNTLITPPLSQNILSGVTRDLTIELAQQHGIKILQQPITKDELLSADEIWITSSTREIFPITKLDGNPVADGKVGPMWPKLVELYQDYIRSFQGE